jgi:hypothetical protein
MDKNSLPFVTRKMLVFDEASAFELEIITTSDIVANVEIQGMTKEGIFRYNFQTTSNSLHQHTLLGVPDAPIWITVKLQSDDSGINNVYALVYLRINGTKNLLLCQGFLGHLYGITWPEQLPYTQLQYRGKQETVFPDSEGIGTSSVFDVPSGEWWIIKSARVQFVTDATATSRQMFLEINYVDGGACTCLVPAVQVASIDKFYSWFDGAVSLRDDKYPMMEAPLPRDILIPPRSNVVINATNMQPFDIIQRATLRIEKHYSNI